MVCKLKFGKLLDNKKDFRSKNFFGAKPRALKVEWVTNFGISNFEPKSRELVQVSSSRAGFKHGQSGEQISESQNLDFFTLT